MSLRWKMSIAILAVVATIVGAVFFISRVTFVHSFQKIDDKEVRETAERASNALDDRLQNLDTLNHDWAAWDDTYSFVLHPE